MPVREPVSKVQVEPPLPRKATGREAVVWAVTNSAIAAAAFLITCVALHAVLPFPEIDGGVSQKFRFFTAHKDEFDTLFIGSSRIYFQISPTVFDRVTHESGLTTHSFNFGIGGMYLPESDYLLEQILNELPTKWSSENQSSRRALYWADWKRVSLLLRKLTDSGTGPRWLPNPAKLRDIILRQNDETNTRSLLTFYAAQMEKNYANVARAADVLDYFLGRDTKGRRASYLGVANDGYVTRPDRMAPSQIAAYERGLADAMAESGTRSLSPYAVEAYRQCATGVRSIGATPIFLITPSTTQISTQMFDRMLRCCDELGKSLQPRLVLDCALIDVATIEPLVPLGDLIERLGQLETRVRAGVKSLREQAESSDQEPKAHGLTRFRSNVFR